MLFKDYLKQQLQDPEFKKLYNELEKNDGKFNDELNENKKSTIKKKSNKETNNSKL